jgi:hypothetical protein
MTDSSGLRPGDSVKPIRDLESMFALAGLRIERRIGAHFVPQVIPLRRLHHTTAGGPVGALGWHLIYLLAPA